MVWSCITPKGVGFIEKIDGTMTALKYINILENNYIPTLDIYELSHNDVVFMQDNDPKHKARITMQWLSENEIEVMDWPAQSADLNPIETFWKQLKDKLGQYEKPATGIDELWRRVKETWNAFPASSCLNHINSMPDRIQAVIKAKGGNTKY